MKFKTNVQSDVAQFDDAWSLGDPVKIEKKFIELLPQAQALEDKSIYLQILSQLALVQSLGQKFTQAHETLNRADALLTPDPALNLARVRLLLEHGRVLQQQDLYHNNQEHLTEIQRYFEQAFELSAQCGFDFHTVNIAHMIAIIMPNTSDKIAWNRRAIDLAMRSHDERTHQWLGSLYNNLGRNYLDVHDALQALEYYQKALEYRKKEGYAPNIRFAEWAVANILRLLGRIDEALALQESLRKEYDVLSKSGTYDVPEEMFILARGLVYEELAELYAAKMQLFARLAYDDLSQNEMFRRTTPERLERLKKLKGSVE